MTDVRQLRVCRATSPDIEGPIDAHETQCCKLPHELNEVVMILAHFRSSSSVHGLKHLSESDSICGRTEKRATPK